MRTKLIGYAIELLPVTRENFQLLREWRNQNDIRAQMGDTALISAELHQAWFDKIEHSQQQLHYIIQYKQQLIGSINVRNSDGLNLTDCKLAEVGLYISAPEYRNNMLAFAPSLLLNDYLFEQLQIIELKSKVRSSNAAALKYNQALGYQLSPIADDNEFIEISLTADNYKKATQMVKRLLSRNRSN
ncbi:GNAT family N-acetyltransferase [Catenovulum sp. SX2]|uniref:GNAT family N-acetyltransferase n=1 Tax=Catenovulum sp. SX2 TaxID=3398614 RepID=UPI003F8314B4